VTFTNKSLFAAVFAASLSGFAYAGEYDTTTVGLQGYDAVGYFADNAAEKGDGNHAATYHDVTYLFATDEHKKEFEANPEKYLPQYGGWCAYGVAIDKKFVADPTVWKIVDNKLYLNLNKAVSDIWSKDIGGYIQKANGFWPDIKEKSPAETNKG